MSRYAASFIFSFADRLSRLEPAHAAVIRCGISEDHAWPADIHYAAALERRRGHVVLVAHVHRSCR
jgi:hypothetical protein